MDPVVTGLDDLPLPPAEPPRPASAGPADWLRRNLFRSPADSVLTVIASVVVGYILFRLFRFVFVTGRWDVIEANLTLFMVGVYPRDELWRIVVSVLVMIFIGGLIAGNVHVRQVAAGRAPRAMSLRRRITDLAVRLWPLILGVAVLLGFTRTITPTLIVIGAVATAIVGRLLGGRLPKGATWALVGIVIVVPIGLLWLLTRPVGWDDWGGIMLNLTLAAAGIALCFPLGVLLALGRRAGRKTDSVTAGIAVAAILAVPMLILLIRRGFALDDLVAWAYLLLAVLFGIGGFSIGRRSSLPLVRVVSIAYIEFFRGVPLYVLLGLGYLGIGFFLPPGVDPPSLVVRAIVVFVLFTAAYIAEIVRGGLQSLPRGQTEAAQALGLSPIKTNALIVLPQALRNVIPALVGQFISLFKDTALAAAAIGFLSDFNVASAVAAQGDFRGQGLLGETLVFAMFLFWVGCITMSRESQRLERKLGVGNR